MLTAQASGGLAQTCNQYYLWAWFLPNLKPNVHTARRLCSVSAEARCCSIRCQLTALGLSHYYYHRQTSSSPGFCSSLQRGEFFVCCWLFLTVFPATTNSRKMTDMDNSTCLELALEGERLCKSGDCRLVIKQMSVAYSYKMHSI